MVYSTPNPYRCGVFVYSSQGLTRTSIQISIGSTLSFCEDVGMAAPGENPAKRKENMAKTYSDLFVKYLNETCDYPRSALRTNTYKYDGKEYDRVEVTHDGYVVQAFVLMSEDHCSRLPKFPFYRTYSQWNYSGNNTPPACNVAVFNKEEKTWEIHSSSDLRHERTDKDFLNYDAAVKRFKDRFFFCGNKKLMKRVRLLSIVGIIIVILYVVAYSLSINGALRGVQIPMNSVMSKLLILIVVLLLLPPLIPYLKIKYNGLSVEVNQDN